MPSPVTVALPLNVSAPVLVSMKSAYLSICVCCLGGWAASPLVAPPPPIEDRVIFGFCLPAGAAGFAVGA